MPTEVRTEADLEPGDFYEDCACHPCLCVRVADDEVSGISLVDGSGPRSCSVRHCGVRRLTAGEAILWRLYGPPGVDGPEGHRWWDGRGGREMACMFRPHGHGGPA